MKYFQSSMLLAEDVDAEAEEVLNELNLLTEHEESIIHVDIDADEWRNCHYFYFTYVDF